MDQFQITCTPIYYRNIRRASGFFNVIYNKENLLFLRFYNNLNKVTKKHIDDCAKVTFSRVAQKNV